MATELLSLYAKIGIDDKEYNKGIDGAEKKGKGFAQVLKTGFKIAAAGMAAATTAVVAIGKAAIQSYAEYEQLVGGVETLFKDSAPIVQEYAANAYKTAGLSANEYMETVTSFSASLLQSVGGDTEKAAKYADQAITDMSDNANKMGTSMESIQVAYQGFAKQNYTMLDNLKLGYGGTKQEMERLIEDAEKLSGKDLDISSYADVVEAIHIIQTEMDITGTTAKEASTTISGSLGMLKSSWQNVLTGVADDKQDFDLLLDNLIDSVVTFGENIIPRIEIALGGVGKLVQGLGERIVPLLVEQLPVILDSLLPAVISTAESLFTSIADIIPQLIPVLLSALPLLLQAGISIILALIQGITENIPMLIPAVIQVVTELATMLTEPDMLMNLINAALELILALTDGLIEALPVLMDAIPVIIQNLITAIIRMAPQLATAALQLIIKLAGGLILYYGKIIEAVVNIGRKVRDKVKDMISRGPKQWGRDMLDTFVSGIKERIGKITDTVKGVANTIKSYLHFSVPDIGPLADADTWMPDFMDLLSSGIDTNKFKVTNAIDDLAGDMMLGGDYGDSYETSEDTQRFEFTFAEGNAPLLQIARLLFPYMQVVSKEKGAV